MSAPNNFSNIASQAVRYDNLGNPYIANDHGGWISVPPYVNVRPLFIYHLHCIHIIGLAQTAGPNTMFGHAYANESCVVIPTASQNPQVNC